MSLADLSAALRGIKSDAEDVDETIHRVNVRIADDLPAARNSVAQYLRFVIGAAEEADAKLKETSEQTQLTIAQLSVMYGEAQKAAEAAEAQYRATLERLADPENLFDYGGQSLEDFAGGGQKDLIEQIGGTNFGAHLDYYAKAYIDMLLGNANAVSGAAYKQLEASEWIIRNFTGGAGQKFDFWQFKADIDAALKGLKNEISGAVSVGSGGYGPSSGTLGSHGAGGGCGASMPSLSILAHAGALRWR